MQIGCTRQILVRPGWQVKVVFTLFYNSSVIEELNFVPIYQILRRIPECIDEGLAGERCGMARQWAADFGLGMELLHELQGRRFCHDVWRSKIVNMRTFYI